MTWYGPWPGPSLHQAPKSHGPYHVISKCKLHNLRFLSVMLKHKFFFQMRQEKFLARLPDQTVWVNNLYSLIQDKLLMLLQMLERIEREMLLDQVRLQILLQQQVEEIQKVKVDPQPNPQNMHNYIKMFGIIRLV